MEAPVKHSVYSFTQTVRESATEIAGAMRSAFRPAAQIDGLRLEPAQRRTIYYDEITRTDLFGRELDNFILLGEGVKPAGDVLSKRSEITSLFERMGLHYAVRETFPDGSIDYWVSYSEKAVAALSARKYNPNDPKDAGILGELLGFPACCVKNYSDLLQTGLSTLAKANQERIAAEIEDVSKHGLDSVLFQSSALTQWVQCEVGGCSATRSIAMKYKKALDDAYPGLSGRIIRESYQILMRAAVAISGLTSAADAELHKGDASEAATA